jgi:hypothetical protein
MMAAISAAYGMEPILAWEHPDDLPEGEFVMVPRLDVHLSAGGGREQVEIDLVKDNPQAFRAEWIRSCAEARKLAAMRASGESMEPTIHDGDSLLVDTSQTNVVDGKVYALWYDGGERVKRCSACLAAACASSPTTRSTRPSRSARASRARAHHRPRRAPQRIQWGVGLCAFLLFFLILAVTK